jgi:hypothetical protein
VEICRPLKKVVERCPKKLIFRLCLIYVALSSVCTFLRGLFAPSLMLLLLFPPSSRAWSDQPDKRSTDDRIKAHELLTRGQYLAELYNWPEAAPAFEGAEKTFEKLGDHRNALFARLGTIRATIEQRNLPETAAWLSRELNSNMLLKTDKKLCLFCLIVKADIDQEVDNHAARADWDQVKALATELGDERWRNRALAQIGITAFYDRDLETASKNVAAAATKATELHDIGGEIRFTTVLEEWHIQRERCTTSGFPISKRHWILQRRLLIPGIQFSPTRLNYRHW